jgi:hypothetical protein
MALISTFFTPTKSFVQRQSSPTTHLPRLENGDVVISNSNIFAECCEANGQFIKL